ncbi:maleylacetoacetate isomerase [Siccirubricoccus deserti]|uniref:Maleylacetoacetate isomerase n=1 Tax=Siccirubricoccus deserti TaxID=2013562 RepID=A0A9X0QV23_9PROT|nr:maleylacetoacetate isomerase [Siccirubricoccus deserti]MBC4013980.1 maleylacetoacetate isomerase [Siccirubricoccus deserti]GGC31082.1 maleylacetoacetate isomerase [Siccirubricoccus deserti]
MILYGHWRSLAAMRVRIALALKGLAYEERSIDILGGGQFAPGFLALNPQAAVPALEAGDGPPLFQSLAILEWLEETHPAPPLLPKDARGRARVRALALISAADSHPLLVPRVRDRLARQFGAGEAAITAWSVHWMATGLRATEAHLARDAVPGPWSHGGAPTLADLFLYSLYAGYEQRGGSLDGMPNIARVVAACEADPCFTAAHPLRQPGAPRR